MLVLNKWNKKQYKVQEVTNKAVTLQREDGMQFTIQKSELLFNYYTRNYEKIEK